MFEKTKRLNKDDLFNMAESCKFDWDISNVEEVICDKKKW